MKNPFFLVILFHISSLQNIPAALFWLPSHFFLILLQKKYKVKSRVDLCQKKDTLLLLLRSVVRGAFVLFIFCCIQTK